MATNEILPFAQGVGANVQSQVDYAAEALRTSGNVPGIARSNVNNKALRQASVIASAIAQYIADNQSDNITDSLTPETIAGYLLAAVRNGVKTDPNFSVLLSVNGYHKFPSGWIIQWGQVGSVGTSGVTVTYPIAFPNAAFVTQVSVSVPSGPVTQYANAVPTGTPKTSLITAINTGIAAVGWVAIGW